MLMGGDFGKSVLCTTASVHAFYNVMEEKGTSLNYTF